MKKVLAGDTEAIVRREAVGVIQTIYHNKKDTWVITEVANFIRLITNPLIFMAVNAVAFLYIAKSAKLFKHIKKRCTL